jgi:hypothetical protein
LILPFLGGGIGNVQEKPVLINRFDELQAGFGQRKNLPAGKAGSLHNLVTNKLKYFYRSSRALQFSAQGRVCWSQTMSISGISNKIRTEVGFVCSK